MCHLILILLIGAYVIGAIGIIGMFSEIWPLKLLLKHTNQKNIQRFLHTNKLINYDFI